VIWTASRLFLVGIGTNVDLDESIKVERRIDSGRVGVGVGRKS